MASKREPYWSPKTVFDQNTRVQNEFIVSVDRRPPFEPVMLFFRGMEKTGSDTRMKGGAVNYSFEMSKLSEGIKCATQGCKCFSTKKYEKKD